VGHFKAISTSVAIGQKAESVTAKLFVHLHLFFLIRNKRKILERIILFLHPHLLRFTCSITHVVV